MVKAANTEVSDLFGQFARNLTQRYRRHPGVAIGDTGTDVLA